MNILNISEKKDDKSKDGNNIIPILKDYSFYLY